MKKLVLCVAFLALLSPSVFAANDYAFKVSVGYLSSPSIAPEIVLDEDNDNTTLEEYEGESGYEAKLSFLISHLEFSYLFQNYSAVREDDEEEGDISFSVETMDFSLYLNDPIENDGFNVFVGAGRGLAYIKANREVNGVTLIDDGVAYAKEFHMHLGLGYGFYESLNISAIYRSQTMKTVTGTDFTNSMGVLTFDYIF